MDRVIILGATNYSFMISDFIRHEEKAEVVAHTVDAKDVEKYQKTCSDRGLKLVPFEELRGADDVKIINAVGYTKMNSIRAIVSEKIQNAGLQVASYISTRATVLPENLVGGGTGNIVFPNAYIGSGVVLGSNNVIYAGAVVTHDVVFGDNNFVAASCTIGGFVTIGNSCFLGMGSTVKNRITLADKTLVGAGAYVSASTEAGDVVVPARTVTLDRKSDTFL